MHVRRSCGQVPRVSFIGSSHFYPVFFRLGCFTSVHLTPSRCPVSKLRITIMTPSGDTLRGTYERVIKSNYTVAVRSLSIFAFFRRRHRRRVYECAALRKSTMITVQTADSPSAIVHHAMRRVLNRHADGNGMGKLSCCAFRYHSRPVASSFSRYIHIYIYIHVDDRDEREVKSSALLCAPRLPSLLNGAS